MALSFTFSGSNGDPLPVDFTSRNGSWKIQTAQRAVAATLGTYPTALSTVTYLADCSVVADINSNSETDFVKPTGYALRWIDNDNYINIAINNKDGLVVFLRRTSGTFTAMETAYAIPSFSASTDYRLGVDLNGTTIKVYLDGVLIATITESQGQTSDIHGLHTFSAYGTADNMVFDVSGALGADYITTTLEDNQGFHVSKGATRTLSVSGSFLYGAGATAIHYKLNGGSAVVGEAVPTGGTYSFDITGLSEGHYDIEVFLAEDVATTISKTQLTLAPAIHGTGQSLMESVGTNNQVLVPSASATAILLGFDDVWKEFIDPWSDHTDNVDPVTDNAVPVGGSWMCHFANSYLAANDSPLIVVPNARGSMSSDKWLKTSTFTDGGTLNLYQALARRIALTDGVEYILWEGNESDIIEARNVTDTKANMNQIINDIFTDFGVKTWIVPMHTYKSGTYDGDGVTYGQIPHRAMQLELAAENANCEIVQPLSDLDVLVGAADDTGDNDGVHFYTDGVLTTVGQRVYASIYGLVSTINITATGTPDATYSTLIFDPTDYSTIYSGDLAYASGAATAGIVPAVVGTDWRGVVFDNEDPNVNGAPITGTTV